MAFQTYNDLMRVIVRATYRRFRRNHMRGLYEARLTRSQLLEDLERQHGQYGLPSRGSMRSLTRWLAQLERAKFFRRIAVDQRDRLGRIRWKLMQFAFGPVGILWIKTNMPDALAGVSRSMWPKLAARFVDLFKDLKPNFRQAVDSHHAVGNSSPPQSARGIATAPKSAALRQRTRSSTAQRATQPKGAGQKGIARRATIAQAPRSARGSARPAKRRRRRS